MSDRSLHKLFQLFAQGFVEVLPGFAMGDFVTDVGGQRFAQHAGAEGDQLIGQSAAGAFFDLVSGNEE